MAHPFPGRATLGLLSSWHLYEGATPEPYAHTLTQGIRSAAKDLGCSLLLACGTGPLSNVRRAEPAWPYPETNESFVPVGPWNTDGLIVLPTELSAGQYQYIAELTARKFPVIFAGSGQHGFSVTIDNRGGIFNAVQHLIDHGHSRIAFIAGLDYPQGDSDQRRIGYREAIQAFGLAWDDRLLAYGWHHFEGGRQAMRRIIAGGAPFTAVIASNDRSAMGAIEALNECGLRVPQDVAIIGFDDVPEAQSVKPALTTLRNPTFQLGYQAVVELVKCIENKQQSIESAVIPCRLVVRYSCGCGAGDQGSTAHNSVERKSDALSELAAEKVLAESRCLEENQVRGFIRQVIGSLGRPPGGHQTAPFEADLTAVLDQTEQAGDDVFIWSSAIAILQARLDELPGLLAQDLPRSQALLERARTEISVRSRLQLAREQFARTERSNRLELLTALLLAALDETQIKAILDQHLPGLGIRHLLVVALLPDEGDPVARSQIILASGSSRAAQSTSFITRQFPPDIYAGDEALHLALLPFSVPDYLHGYIACDAEHMELLGALVLNLASALRSSYLYRDALRGRQMAEEADRLKSRFLSMVSHELRTPINLIIGLSEMLLRQQDHTLPLPSDRWQDIERITSNAQHLSNLINDVLDLASSEVGQLRLLLEPLDLCEVLRPVAAVGQQMAAEKGLEWRANLPDSGPWVMGDRTRLRQVVLNLISNAAKFTSTGQVRLEVRLEGEQVKVSVSDTGQGVPPAEQGKIFGEFGRSDLAVKRGIGGMGLGLAIAKQLVERQGGQIGVTSSGQEGSGSTFFFTLPSIQPPQEAEPAGLFGQVKGIALLTERAVMKERLASPLQALGFTFQVYDISADPDWLLHLTTNAPGFIILDEQLVAERGWTVLGALKRQPSTELVPLLICRLDEDGDRNALVGLDYLFKPLNPNQLLRELERYGLTDSAPLVLVVDDNASIRDLHTRLLREQLARCTVLEAENGLAALQILGRHRPDLVLLDLMMPEMDGFELLEAMRTDERTRDVPVIVLTAKTLTEEDMARLNRGVTAILNKDMFSSSEIAERVASVLAQDRSLGTASQRFVRRAIAFIQAHYAESLTRDLIAQHVNVSPDHLTDCFHKEAGLTPIAYLNRYRINRARQLLEMGAPSITEVMLQVGFSDSAHFSRVFQREVGVSPSRYLISRREIISLLDDFQNSRAQSALGVLNLLPESIKNIQLLIKTGLAGLPTMIDVPDPKDKAQTMAAETAPILQLVDNNPEFAYLIERYIQPTGWTMNWTASLHGAEEQLQLCPPNIILLNLLIPTEGAWNFLRRLKTDPETQNIPVAVYSSVPDEARAQLAGADYYLWHPILFEDFEHILNEVLLLR